MRNRILNTCAAVFGGLVLAGTATAQEYTIPVMVPDADVIMQADMKKYGAAPIYKELKTVMDKLREQATKMNPQAAEQSQKMEKIMQAMGLTEEDLTGFFMAMDLDPILAAGLAGGPPAFNSISMVMAMDLAKSVSMAGLKSAVALMAAENQGMGYEDAVCEGVQALRLKTKQENKDDALLIAVVGDGKRILAGTETGLKNGLSLQGEKALAALTQNMSAAKNSIPKDAQSWLAMVLPEAARQQLAAMAAAGQNPAAPAGAQPPTSPAAIFSGLETLTAFSSAAQDMKCTVQFGMGAPEQGEALKNFLDIQVISGIRMGLMMLGGGQIMPMAASLKTSQSKSGKAVRLSFAMNSQDIQLLDKALQESPLMKGGMGGAGGGLPSGMPLPLPLPAQ